MINLKQFFRVLEEKEKAIYSFNGFKYNYRDISVLSLTKLFVYRVTLFNDKMMWLSLYILPYIYFKSKLYDIFVWLIILLLWCNDCESHSNVSI